MTTKECRELKVKYNALLARMNTAMDYYDKNQDATITDPDFSTRAGFNQKTKDTFFQVAKDQDETRLKIENILGRGITKKECLEGFEV